MRSVRAYTFQSTWRSPVVRWQGVVHPAYKTDPGLLESSLGRYLELRRERDLQPLGGDDLDGEAGLDGARGHDGRATLLDPAGSCEVGVSAERVEVEPDQF